MQIIEAPSNEIAHYPALFLGGGISGCEDWQKRFLSWFKGNEKVTIYNPRREQFDISKIEESGIQIAWEWIRLRRSQINMYWFPHETLCPITLMELGGSLERNHDIVIGCHPDYKRKFDVEFQTHMMRPDLVIHDSLEKVFTDVQTLINFKI